MKKKSQNIYHNKVEENDLFTPQISKDVINQKQKDLNRIKINNLILGSSVLIISLTLVFILIFKYFQKNESIIVPPPITQGYIPKYTLDNESRWVMDFDNSFLNTSSSENGEKPFNLFWLKKATYNLILGEQAYEFKEYKRALNYFQNAYDIIPNLEDLPIRIGMCYLQLKEYEKAIELLQDTDINSLNKTVLNNIGAAFINAKSYDLALIYLNKSISLDPLYANPLKNLAQLYKETEKKDEAITCYEKYLDQNPYDNDTRYFLALYLTKLDKNLLAIEHLNFLIDNITNDPSLYILLYYNAKQINNLQLANNSMIKASNLAGVNNPLKWMTDDEFNNFKNSDNFESIMINK